MSAPERIWAASVTENYGEWQTTTDGLPRPTEYVRADIVTARIAALEAQLAERVKIGPLAHVIAEMLDRAGEPRPNGDVLHDILAQALPSALEATPPAPKVTEAMVERALIEWFDTEVTWDRGMTPPMRSRMVESMRAALTAAQEAGKP